jgi:Ran GTPase-activating protein (RanGAP) involved in mRNA processing and transport
MCENWNYGTLHMQLNGIALVTNGLLWSAKGILRAVQGPPMNQMGRCSALDLARTRIGRFELEFLASLFWRMTNLEEIDLSGSFEFTKDGIVDILPELLCLPALRRIRIAGFGQKELRRDLLPTLERLIRYNCQLLELDVSNNILEDDGIETVLKLVAQSPDLDTLALDGNRLGKRHFE